MTFRDRRKTHSVDHGLINITGVWKTRGGESISKGKFPSFQEKKSEGWDSTFRLARFCDNYFTKNKNKKIELEFLAVLLVQTTSQGYHQSYKSQNVPPAFTFILLKIRKSLHWRFPYSSDSNFVYQGCVSCLPRLHHGFLDLEPQIPLDP